MEIARECQKNICFFDYLKVFVGITANWKILKEMRIPDHLICLLRNLCMQVKKQQLELHMEHRLVQK